jgi:DNA-binding response OmpR family regulator/HPt (histidine-containing phosphotransfer) domain-containing protein
MKILLVEDDDALITLLSRYLTAQNYVVDAVKDGEMGWSYGSTFEYDLILLDIVLPRLDGISLCQRFRAEGITTPILLLTAEDSSTAKVQGLDAGADDYVVKPFDRPELIARVRALLRRGSGNPLPLLTWGDLFLNPSTCEVSYDGHPLTLTTKEYEFLELLLRDSQHVFSTDEILDRLWSSEDFPSEATVRSHIRRVRQKLTKVGAPPDFIATLHGRGYYLKAPDAESAINSDLDAASANRRLNHELSAPPTAPVGSDTPSAPTHEQQEQYAAFLNETWTTTKPKSLAQVEVLATIADRLRVSSLNDSDCQQVKQSAHKLAGTLSIFGMDRAVHLARQLEHWFASPEPPLPKQAPLAHALIMALRQEIQNTTEIHANNQNGERSLHHFPGDLPLVLLVGVNKTHAQPLLTLAQNRGIRMAIAPNIESAASWLKLDSLAERVDQRPSVLVFWMPVAPANQNQYSQSLRLLEEFAQRYPTLPIIVLGHQHPGEDSSPDYFMERLDVVRHGGSIFLPAQTVSDEILSIVMGYLGKVDVPAKVMIVDDDRHWLQTLPTLLKPWGFKVTTLDDPQQFWLMLQAIAPDVLVLDVNMPDINGFELCQVLRSDPHWQRVPVLFLSVLTDSRSQSRAFAVGADDYLCKPVMGIDLANRILNRLQRLRIWSE